MGCFSIKHRAITQASLEMIHVCLLIELSFLIPSRSPIFCDNQAAYMFFIVHFIRGLNILTLIVMLFDIIKSL